MAKIKINWLQLCIDLIKVLGGAIAGGVATATSDSVNAFMYNISNLC